MNGVDGGGCPACQKKMRICVNLFVCCPNVELHHGVDWMYSMVSPSSSNPSLPPVDLKVDRG